MKEQVFGYSVIIPTFNEAENILKALASVENAFYNSAEIIVVDGGSSDKTLSLVDKEKVKVIEAQANRAAQMNKGAEAASGNILIFLHADSQLPNNAKKLIDEFFADDSNQLSLFKIEFDDKSFLMKMYAWFSRFDSLLTSFGDQCIVVRKNIFFAQNKFPQFPICEDVEFLREARKKYSIKKLNGFVCTSARRYRKNGIIKQQLLNAYLLLKYLFKFNLSKIAEQYDFLRKQNFNSALIIFAKYPAKGKVKTRLGAVIGDEAGLDFYKYSAGNIFQTGESVRNNYADVFIFFAGCENENVMKVWVKHNFYFNKQNGIDLGERMKNAFEALFKKNYRQVVIIGTDSPTISPDMILTAFQKLESNDIVLGPTFDGGYYLLGMKKFFPPVFENINWSSVEVFSQTLQRTQSLKLSTHILEKIIDVDTVSDLRIYIESLSTDRVSELRELSWHKKLEV